MLTQEQLAERQSGIGGSDVAGIIGISKWSSQYKVWRSKVDPLPPVQEEEERLYWGHMLEPVIRDEFARRNGVEVVVPNVVIRHKLYPWMLANVDGCITGRNEGLECKNVSEFMAKEWGDEIDEAPEYYLTQGLHYLAVMEWERIHFAALIGGNRYRQYTVESDPEAINDLVRVEKHFWETYVVPRVPPPMSGADFKEAWPRTNGKIIQAPPAVVESCRRLRERAAELAALTKEVEAMKDELKNIIQDNEALVGEDGKPLITWTYNKPSEAFDDKAFQKRMPKLFRRLNQRFSMEVPGPRVFRIKK